MRVWEQRVSVSVSVFVPHFACAETSSNNPVQVPYNRKFRNQFAMLLIGSVRKHPQECRRLLNITGSKEARKSHLFRKAGTTTEYSGLLLRPPEKHEAWWSLDPDYCPRRTIAEAELSWMSSELFLFGLWVQNSEYGCFERNGFQSSSKINKEVNTEHRADWQLATDHDYVWSWIKSVMYSTVWMRVRNFVGKTWNARIP